MGHIGVGVGDKVLRVLCFAPPPPPPPPLSQVKVCTFKILSCIITEIVNVHLYHDCK